MQGRGGGQNQRDSHEGIMRVVSIINDFLYLLL